MAKAVITAARVDADNGTVAATIDLIQVGGGVQTVTVDGKAEERVHPLSSAYHVRFISPDRMIPDEVRDCDSFDDACELAKRYAAKLAEHADRIAEIAGDLKV